jgi:transposase
MRAHMVLLSARGKSAYDIADIHGVSDPTVYKWIERFDAEGPDGLFDRDRDGRPRKVDDEAEAELLRVLDAPPTDEGYEFSNWTVPRLTEHLDRKLGLDVHPETVRQALHRLRFSHTRPRRRLPDDPAYDETIAVVDRAVAEVGAETTVLFQDETELHRFPPLRGAWSPVGEQAEVAVPMQNGKFALYGTLDVLTGETIMQDYPAGRSDHTISFLETVLDQVKGEILLVWDNARPEPPPARHTSKAVESFLAEHERLEVLALPKRSPEDNPIEDLWRVLKNVIAANLERSLDALRSAYEWFFDRLTPEQALVTAGLS